MNGLPTRIYRAAQVREMDRLAIEQCEIPGFTLMSRAGQAVLAALQARWPGARRLLVLCGAGNNAGDGYVVARLAERSGLKVTTVALVNPDKLSGDARLAWDMYRKSGGSVREWSASVVQGCDVVIDAMLGTGLARDLEGKPRNVVAALNDSATPVLAVDVPTGLHADTGHAMGIAVRADLTVTFVALKLGLYTGEGPEYAGEICFDGLGIPDGVYAQATHAGERIDESLLRRVLPPRHKTAHKGEQGNILLIGGGAGMPGAIRLSAEAALHAGAGTVTVATLPEHIPLVLAARPELMGRGVGEPDALLPLLEAADVIGIGPGLGQDAWARGMLQHALACDKPLIVDADALNLLAAEPRKRGGWVLTPHPGEAARLAGTGTSAKDVQQDRIASVARLIERYSAVVVLKGAGSIVARNGDVPWFCDRGNPGMAAPGMGDVLTGVIAAIAGQCGDLFDAARAGVLVHAAAGDDAAQAGERGVLASDLFPHLVGHVNPG